MPISFGYFCKKIAEHLFATLQGFVSSTVFPPGSAGYDLLTTLYIKFFDTLLRQPIRDSDRQRILEAGRQQRGVHAISQDDPDSDLPREQNPREVGRHRRPMHCSANSFLTRSEALKHWRDNSIFRSDRQEERVKRDDDDESVLWLTGRAGEPDEASPWLFTLIGDSFSLPQDLSDWLFPHALSVSSSSSRWHRMALPSHWQLQGFDVPLYTNTAYPFRLDPPFTVRDGTYSLPLCDAGLGATHCERVHENEPGVNATGLFRRAFRLPRSWSRSSIFSHRVLLVFEGVDASLTVFLNGEFVGYSEDSCLHAEFDVTELLQRRREKDENNNEDDKEEGEAGENLLCVQVSRFCSGSYLEDQDKWSLSGIYREVFLQRTPAACLSDVEFRCDIDFEDEREDGAPPAALGASLAVSVLAEGVQTRIEQADAFFARRENTHAVRVELWDDSARGESESETESESDAALAAVATCELFPQSLCDARRVADRVLDVHSADREMSALRAPGFADVALRLTAPRLWSAETPQLYTLVVTLFPSLAAAQDSSEEHELHTLTLRVGLREVRVDRDPQSGSEQCLLVNRRRITIAGVNRVEFDPQTGRAVSERTMRDDALLIKRLNFNAVRTAHFPQHPHWLRVCDEVGLYVIDEANIETHGFQALGQPVGFLSHDINWRGALAARVARMFERDKNHASVIGWSLGNESGHGPTHDLLADWLRARDPRRFVQYESGGSRTYATDIICPMYQHPDWCATQSTTAAPRLRPVVLCEYAHAMGNSGGCLAQYWRLFRDEEKRFPRVQGGFIWDFVDQGLAVRGSAPAERKFLFGGDFGESPHSKNFCCNGLTAPDRVPHPHAFEAAFWQSPVSVRWSKNGNAEEPLALTVRNWRSFLALDDVSLTVTPILALRALQEPIAFPSFSLDVQGLPAGGKREFSLSELLAQSASASDAGCVVREGEDAAALAWLDIRATQRRGTAVWVADEDAELLRTSLSSAEVAAVLVRHCVLSRASSDAEDSPRSEKESALLRVDESDSTLTIRWTGSGESLSFDKRRAQLTSWTLSGGEEELLRSPVEVCLYRALTDNDRGGALLSYAAQWRGAGYHSLAAHRATLHWERSGDDEDEESTVRVVTRFSLEPSDPAAQSGLSVRCELVFLFNAHRGQRRGGGCEITSTVWPVAEFPAPPRVGLRFALPGDWDDVQWLGLGPHEAYEDRKGAAYLGLFRATVDELHSHYVFPQENGRRADPRWVTFAKKNGSQAIAILPNSDGSLSHVAQSVSGYGFSASRFSLEELDAKEHDFELVPAEDRRVFVHVDSRTMGVGGYDSWSPNVDDEFLIDTTHGPVVTTVTIFHRSL